MSGPASQVGVGATTAAHRLRRAASLLLRDRDWALALAGVIVLCVVFVLLGRWQYGRHEAKVERNARIDANYSAAAVPLDHLLTPPSGALAASDRWRPAQVRGRYETKATVLVRNRPLDGVFGYEVVVPLRTDAGAILLVDRGWVPNGQTGAAPDAVPEPPDGAVTVVVRLRSGEPSIDRTPPRGQAFRIDPTVLGSGLGGPVLQAYGVLAAESPAPGVPLTALPRPDEDLGPHLAYAVQWWGFAAAAPVLLFHYLDREARRRAGEPARVPFPRRPRRTEPTDEEWEDAADRRA